MRSAQQDSVHHGTLEEHSGYCDCLRQLVRHKHAILSEVLNRSGIEILDLLNGMPILDGIDDEGDGVLECVVRHKANLYIRGHDVKAFFITIGGNIVMQIALTSLYHVW